jgi:hypothetical protein
MMTGRKHTPETKAKMSAMRKKYYENPINREKNSLINKGRKFGPEVRMKMSLAHKGKIPSLASRAKRSASLSGEKNHQWMGGLSFEPYCPKFNRDLRRRIRAFFGHKCILCGKTSEENKRELNCHHVEYNKAACCDGKPVHFAAICHKCHVRTNVERDRWEAMMHRIINEIYGGRSYFTKEEWIAQGDTWGK